MWLTLYCNLWNAVLGADFAFEADSVARRSRLGGRGVNGVHSQFGDSGLWWSGWSSTVFRGDSVRRVPEFERVCHPRHAVRGIASWRFVWLGFDVARVLQLLFRLTSFQGGVSAVHGVFDA